MGKVEKRDNGKQVITRLQFKTARESPSGGAGFVCDLCTRAGTYKGKKKVQPYTEGAFDELVAVAWVEDEAGKQKAGVLGHPCESSEGERLSTIGIGTRPWQDETAAALAENRRAAKAECS